MSGSSCGHGAVPGKGPGGSSFAFVNLIISGRDRAVSLARNRLRPRARADSTWFQPCPSLTAYQVEMQFHYLTTAMLPGIAGND